MYEYSNNIYKKSFFVLLSLNIKCRTYKTTKMVTHTRAHNFRAYVTWRLCDVHRQWKEFENIHAEWKINKMMVTRHCLDILATLSRSNAHSLHSVGDLTFLVKFSKNLNKNIIRKTVCTRTTKMANFYTFFKPVVFQHYNWQKISNFNQLINSSLSLRSIICFSYLYISAR